MHFVYAEDWRLRHEVYWRAYIVVALGFFANKN